MNVTNDLRNEVVDINNHSKVVVHNLGSTAPFKGSAG